ncbi:MAG: hypothetical protein EBZ51_11640, partial [Synechococcaceae bacterium WB9_2_112]|nr:hypothetical protein [Synechococcaceae bacterium WB9_2_112]
MNSVLQQRGFQIHPGIVNDGQLSIGDAFRSVVGIQQQAAAGDGSRATGAAANLCYGSPFDPCALSDSDTGPFSPDCITKAALAAGWGAAGAQMPANGGMAYWNALPNWGAVRTAIANTKRQADNPPGATGGSFAGQMAAIYSVYGVKPQPPRIGCNYQGISLLRWLAPTGSTPQSLFPAAGAQTHFLGRYLARNGFPSQAAPTAADMTPAGGFLTECQRYTTVFQPAAGGNYQFMSMSPDPVRMFLNGNLFMDWQGSGNAVTPITSMIAEQQYTLTVDIMNSGGDWGFQIQASVNGGSWGPLPTAQLFLLVDRRQPLLELAFNKMATGATGATQDTNSIIQNWTLFGSTRIGTVAGRPCMVVGGRGQGCYNFNNYAQGIRSRALKSFTMLINIQSITLGRDSRGGSYTPSFVAFYNLPSTNTAGYPRTGAPP